MIFHHWGVMVEELFAYIFGIYITFGYKNPIDLNSVRFGRHCDIGWVTSLISQWKMDGNKRNLNCFYSIFAKKRNSHGHFKYIKKHKILPRNFCFCVITLCSSNFFLLISMILNLNCFYSISANRRKQKNWFLWKNMHQSMPRNWENSSSMLQLPLKYFISIE